MRLYAPKSDALTHKWNAPSVMKARSPTLLPAQYRSRRLEAILGRVPNISYERRNPIDRASARNFPMHPKVARGRKADLYGQTGIDAVAPIPDLPALAPERGVSWGLGT